MGAPSADITALLSSRICHDLISPLGAIGNGVELLSMAGVAQSPEMVLIAESVEQASARVRFFRIAFGAATPEQRVSTAEITSILKAQSRGGRLRMDWRACPELPRPEVKLAFLYLLCLETSLPQGGTITVEGDASDCRLTAAGRELRLETEAWQALCAGGAAPQEPALVHFTIARETARQIGRTPHLTPAEGSVELRF